MPLAPSHREAIISGCPLFRGLDAHGAAAIAAVATEVEFRPEHAIARQGEIGSGMFIVVDGRVRVVRDGQVVTRLGPGEFFGELSVLDGAPRNATVTAEVTTTCLAVATWDAERVMREEPGVALALLRVLAGRLREAVADHRY
jgi:CRP/FNR family transcriptional regulator, cyclic AMP receptor protein